MFDTIKEAPVGLRPAIPTGNGPTTSLVTGEQRTYDSGHARLSNGVERNDEGSPPPLPKRISPRNSEFSSQTSEISGPQQPNGIPDPASNGSHQPSAASMETSDDDQRERAFSVTEETRVLDEALSRTSTASLDGANELHAALSRNQVDPGRGAVLEGAATGAMSDRSNFENLEGSGSFEEMETGGADVGGEEVRGKPSAHNTSSQDEDSGVSCVRWSGQLL